MEKICGIYKIISPSKRIYVGQSVNIYKRWSLYRILDCKKQTLLYNSLKKYGINKHKFEILEQCSPEELNQKEIYYIELYQCFNSKYGLNLREGGGSSGKMSNETKRKISIGNTGKIQTEEAKQKRKDTIARNGGYTITKEAILRRINSDGFKKAMEKRKFIKDELRQEIRKLYLNGKHTQEEIGIIYGIGKRLVNKICSEAGIKNMRTLEYKRNLIINDINILRIRYLNGETINNIRKEYRTDFCLIKDIFNEYGIEVSRVISCSRRLKLRKRRNGLTDEQIIEVRNMGKNKIKPKIIIKQFNINYSIYNNIMSGKFFKYLFS